jgi:hypothetical protein
MKAEAHPPHQDPHHELIGRKNEVARLRAAIRDRESLLIWGPEDAGKTSLVKNSIAGLPEKDRKRCIYWSGKASVRRLAEELVRGLHAAGDPRVREKMSQRAVGCDLSAAQCFRRQSSGQLKALLYLAAPKGGYSIFLDHMPPATLPMARFLKEIIWRCKTPVCLLARGRDRNQIGCAWSIYFANEFRIEIGPLSESSALELLEQSIRCFRLNRFDLTGFREEILRLSRRLPGSIIKMCELSADQRYHHSGQIKINLVHVDYLMLRDPLHATHARPHRHLPHFE